MVINDTANAYLDSTYGSGTPTSIFFALLTSMPDTTGAGYAEPSDANYARVELTNNSTNFPAASAGIKQLGVAVTFPAADAEHVVVGIATFDASSGGTPIHAQQFASNETIAAGNSANFPSGQLRFTR